jgi:hypothetical protein
MVLAGEAPVPEPAVPFVAGIVLIALCYRRRMVSHPSIGSFWVTIKSSAKTQRLNP